MDTQMMVKHCTVKVCEGFSLNDACVYSFCKKGDFLALINGYSTHYKMTIFIPFFVFAAQIECKIFVSFWGTNKYTDAKKDAK